MNLKCLKREEEKEINLLEGKKYESEELMVPTICKIERKVNSTEKTEAIYPYTDEKGKVLFEIEKRKGEGQPYYVRYKKEKDNEFEYKLPEGIEIPIYNLTFVQEAIKNERPIWITEGESKVEALKKIGIIATTVPFKSPNKWNKGYNHFLEGIKNIIVLVDNDNNSELFAEHTIEELQYLNCSVNIYKIKISDICSSIKYGGDIEDLIEIFGDEKVKITLESIENLLYKGECL
jgi:hypothetical protein